MWSLRLIDFCIPSIAGMPGHGEKVARDELKNVDQIRKDRAKKANLKELQVPPCDSKFD